MTSPLTCSKWDKLRYALLKGWLSSYLTRVCDCSKWTITYFKQKDLQYAAGLRYKSFLYILFACYICDVTVRSRVCGLFIPCPVLFHVRHCHHAHHYLCHHWCRWPRCRHPLLFHCCHFILFIVVLAIQSFSNHTIIQATFVCVFVCLFPISSEVLWRIFAKLAGCM